MTSWGSTSTNRTKPKFLVPGGTYSPDNCFATERGWEYRHTDGSVELLVTIPGLATALGESQITQVFFDKATYAPGDVAELTVSFTEAVTISSGTPTLSVTTVSGADSPITFTYASGSGTNELVFTATLTDGTFNGEVISVAGQSFGGGASFADAPDTTFVNGDRGPVPNASVYADPVVSGALIRKVAFTDPAFTESEDEVSVKILYNAAVVVTGVPTLIVAQTTVGDITLLYTSGTGTDTLIFTKTAAGLVETETLSISGQTLGTPGGATITGLGVAADVVFVNGDRTADDFSGAYVDIVVGA